jgi:lipopolysaccharide/colanic/teichoic acid biosynthesis glycosyltransferase
VFRFYKFRTLHAETRKLTPIGRWLQRSNLDELPQLIHMLRGEMSLVGNRPLPLKEAEQLTTDQWAQRFLAPVGITGLWQLARRNQPNLSEEDRRKLEVNYVSEASLRGDLRILFRTLLILIRKPH